VNNEMLYCCVHVCTSSVCVCDTEGIDLLVFGDEQLNCRFCPDRISGALNTSFNPLGSSIFV
jgi:hypothetical protein